MMPLRIAYKRPATHSIPGKQQLATRIAYAESAIAKRLQALSQNAAHRAELHAIEDALAALRTLKEEP
jgi:hypothetical protein